MVDGCIDGYSRLITHLSIRRENLATSALDDFWVSVHEYGVPGRVRANKGNEFHHAA